MSYSFLTYFTASAALHLFFYGQRDNSKLIRMLLINFGHPQKSSGH